MKYTVCYTLNGEDCEERVNNARERDNLIEELNSNRYGKYKNVHFVGTTQCERENRYN